MEKSLLFQEDVSKNKYLWKFKANYVQNFLFYETYTDAPIFQNPISIKLLPLFKQPTTIVVDYAWHHSELIKNLN